MREDWTLGDVVIGLDRREATIIDWNPHHVLLQYHDDDSTIQVSRSQLLDEYWEVPE